MTTPVKPVKEQRPTILVIEDEPSLADIYSTSFGAAGLDVAVAGDGVEGLELALRTRPELILLDLVLPIKDGFEVLRDLKSNPRTKDIPVIILSNLGQDYEVKHGMDLGAACFLVKTEVEPAKLVQKVKAFLDGRTDCRR